MPTFKQWLFGKSGKVKKASLKTKEQEKLNKEVMYAITKKKGPLKGIFGDFDPEQFQKTTGNPALKNFKENILPSLEEKFVSQGNVQSSAFNKQRIRAGTDLQEKLATLMEQSKEQHKQNQIQGINTSLGFQPLENIYKGPSKGVVEGVIQGVAENPPSFGV